MRGPIVTTWLRNFVIFINEHFHTSDQRKSLEYISHVYLNQMISGQQLNINQFIFKCTPGKWCISSVMSCHQWYLTTGPAGPSTGNFFAIDGLAGLQYLWLPWMVWLYYLYGAISCYPSHRWLPIDLIQNSIFH